jgi:hypothetical protein
MTRLVVKDTMPASKCLGGPWDSRLHQAAIIGTTVGGEDMSTETCSTQSHDA